MRVFRLERKDNGSGPFYDNDIANSSSSEMRDEVLAWRWQYIGDSHPVPFDDGIEMPIGYRDNWLFGCPDMRMIWHWFGPIMKYIDALNYHVVEYEVDSSYVQFGCSGTQVLFDKSNANLTSP